MTLQTWRIGTRLLVAQALVVVAAIATAAIIAALIGPHLFHEHMLQADRNPDPTELAHMEEAYRAANAISLGVAIAAALVIALVVSWYLTRRFQTPITNLNHAAAEVAAGRYGTRVTVGVAGPELDSLATSFNTMAAQLAHTEDTRRRLLADLAHELRTPVATLTAYLEGLEDGVRIWDAETRGVLVDQVGRLATLTQDIDAVSRAEEGRLRLDTSLASLTEMVTAAVRGKAQAFATKAVHLTTSPGPEVIVPVDPTRIGQVLTNLLDNALRHTPTGGTVSVEWRTEHNRVVIAVLDTGDGIPASQLPHIFERFYRGDTARSRDHQGSGIGLTISRAIAEAHGGRLEAVSPGPGAGSTFALTLPADEAAP